MGVYGEYGGLAMQWILILFLILLGKITVCSKVIRFKLYLFFH